MTSNMVGRGLFRLHWPISSLHKSGVTFRYYTEVLQFNPPSVCAINDVSLRSLVVTYLSYNRCSKMYWPPIGNLMWRIVRSRSNCPIWRSNCHVKFDPADRSQSNLTLHIVVYLGKVCILNVLMTNRNSSFKNPTVMLYFTQWSR